MATETTDKELTFEQALKQLETVASKLEAKETTLDEAVSLSKQGTELSAVCEKKLTEAAGKIKQLVGNEESDFNVGDDNDFTK